LEHTAIEVVLSTQKGIESVTVPYVGKKLILVERPPGLHNLETGVLELFDVRARCIDEARS
jgi:hypothetical protein